MDAFVTVARLCSVAGGTHVHSHAGTGKKEVGERKEIEGAAFAAISEVELGPVSWGHSAVLHT
jgi:hypothetical protein